MSQKKSQRNKPIDTKVSDMKPIICYGNNDKYRDALSIPTKLQWNILSECLDKASIDVLEVTVDILDSLPPKGDVVSTILFRIGNVYYERQSQYNIAFFLPQAYWDRCIKSLDKAFNDTNINNPIYFILNAFKHSFRIYRRDLIRYTLWCSFIDSRLRGLYITLGKQILTQSLSAKNLQWLHTFIDTNFLSTMDSNMNDLAALYAEDDEDDDGEDDEDEDDKADQQYWYL